VANVGFCLKILRVLPPPLGLVLPELRRGSPKRHWREGGCVQRRFFSHTLKGLLDCKYSRLYGSFPHGVYIRGQMK